MLSWSQRVCPTLRALTIDQLTPPHVHNMKPVVQFNSVRLTALPIDKLTQSHVHTIWNLLCTIIVSVSLHCQLIIWSRLTFTVWSLHTRTRWSWVIFQQKTQLFPENKSLGFIRSIWIYSGIWLWTARRCQCYLMSELPGIPGVLVARTMGWDWLRVQIRLNLYTTILETCDFWGSYQCDEETWPDQQSDKYKQKYI